MVFKQKRRIIHHSIVWERCKNVWYSNLELQLQEAVKFENDVKMYGIQTGGKIQKLSDKFENDVKMYGIQTLLVFYHVQLLVWERCKNVWYSNSGLPDIYNIPVWERCKNVWYSNMTVRCILPVPVWERCKNVWYSNFVFCE